jgi:hypothetical protein
MGLAKLYEVKMGGDLTPEDCLEINEKLSKVDITKIPTEQLANVRDYLVSALNMNSVNPKHIEALDLLLRELQNKT